MKIRISQPLVSLFLLFLILFLPQCITVPVTYETAEPKDEERVGVSAQYGRGSYTIGLCETRKYNYRYGGIRADYGKVKRYGKLIEAGFELGASINAFEQISTDADYYQKGVVLQTDGRLTGKIVTPTSPVRAGLKVAPGLLGYGGVSRTNGNDDISEGYSYFSFFSYFSLLLGIGNPEFLTLGYNYYCTYYPFLFIGSAPYYSKFTATYHQKKYSITTGVLLPLGQHTDEIPKYHLILGLGIHY